MPIPWVPTRPTPIPDDKRETSYDDIYRSVTGKGRYHIDTGTTWLKPFPIRTFEERVEDKRRRLMIGLIVFILIIVLLISMWRKND